MEGEAEVGPSLVELTAEGAALEDVVGVQPARAEAGAPASRCSVLGCQYV